MAEDDRLYSTREMFDEIRKDISGLRDEIRTSRHDLAGKLAAVALRVDRLEYQQLDTARRFQEVDERAAKYVPLVDHLMTEETLSSKMKTAGWTRRERLLAYGLFAFAFIGAVGTVVSLVVLTMGG